MPSDQRLLMDELALSCSEQYYGSVRAPLQIREMSFRIRIPSSKNTTILIHTKHVTSCANWQSKRLPGISGQVVQKSKTRKVRRARADFSCTGMRSKVCFDPQTLETVFRVCVFGTTTDGLSTNAPHDNMFKEHSAW